MDKLKTGSGKRLRTEALAEVTLPVPYDAAAMPGASVLGTDGRVYVSQKNNQGIYEWQSTVLQQPDGDIYGDSLLLGGGSVRRNNIIRNQFAGGIAYTPTLQIEAVGPDEPTLSIVSVGSASTLVLGRVNGTAIGDNGAVIGVGGLPADRLVGSLSFHGSDGTSLLGVARINALADGAVLPGEIPGRLQIGVRLPGSTPLGISNIINVMPSGNVLINNTSGTERLSVTGNIQLTETSDSYKVGADNVVGSRKTGWDAPTGTATRTTFVTSSVTTEQLSERLKALIDDLTSHGLIGPAPSP